MSNSTFPFDAVIIQAYKSNPAIRLFGNRFSNDQTSMELLCEFLLVITSKKRIDDAEFATAFPPITLLIDWNNVELEYAPKARLNLKLFAFLSASRLDSRHLTHREHYAQIIQEIKNRISIDSNDKTQVVKTLENLLLGFQGAGSGRTWCTQSFLPLSKSLLACEAIWKETSARRFNPNRWGNLFLTRGKYFSTSQHAFYAGGGELLYLQICNAMKQSPDAIQSWNQEANLELKTEELEPG